ncbi:unnamed protein product [Urochloa humidicola]
MQRRGEFSFPGSPARGLLPPRPPPAANATAVPRYGVEDEEEVRWLQASRQASPDYSSGTPSPQLWTHHNHSNHNYLHRPYPASAGSSPSRAQAIAGYRREMLDLVRGLPESAYELSLRDIVEYPPASLSSSSPPPLPPLPPPPSNSAAAERNDETTGAGAGKDATAEAQVEEGKKQSGFGGKKQGRKQRTMRKQRSRSMERSVSLDTGLLIKLFMPLSMGGKKKVSPRPDAAKDGKKGKKDKKQGKKDKQPEAAPAVQEEEWWSKSEFSEAGGSSRTSSTGSSSNNSAGSIKSAGHVNGSANPRAPARSWSRKRTGCYAFFRANKSKNGVGQD